MNSGTSHQRTIGGGVQHVLDYLKRMHSESPAFFYAIQGDTEHSNGNIFWADGNARMNYNYFGDTVKLDTSYQKNGFRVPFVTFTGLNHHGQPILFGCALLFDESETSFIWLLQTWLQAMSARHPLSITTVADRHIQMAVSQVLPETRHRLCKWSIIRETKEKLSHIYQIHPTFEIEFNKCINEPDTVEEFESQWGSLVLRYYLMDNEWLQSMYNARHHWVPIYLRDTFFGESFYGEDSDAMNSFFDGILSVSTTIQLLTKLYEKGITSWHEKELKADFDTNNSTPILKTPSPMEKQAANLYTRRIFMKFQAELVETLANPATKIDDSGTTTTYRVSKFGEEHKAHTVRFNDLEMKANCSCLMFEFSGIICRHVLSVFRAKNVLTLPSQYILKRWTRDAKISGGVTPDERALELPNSAQESLTVRYNNLRREAIKFVEEGAKSIHVYNVAMNALKEAEKKVSTAKTKKFGETHLTNLANGNLDMHAGDENQVAPTDSLVRLLAAQKNEKEKRIHELTAELDSINQRCEVYRSNLLAVLKDTEEQKLKLSVKVQNARLSLKE
nr:protein FAR1-RELATED SEQUENCE 9 [Ipomoea batatas]